MTDTTACVPLYARTLELATNAPRSIKQKHMAAAIGKSESWISEFLKGKHSNPSVHTVQALHDFLMSNGGK